jgi:hypothetical protein
VFRSFRVPEKLFAVAMWAVSVTFAGFLIGMGGEIVGDLPGVDQQLSLSEFVDPLERVPLLRARDSLVTLQRSTQDARERASQRDAVARSAYASQRETFDTWIAARTATTDPSQDPEVLSRTRLLESLKREEREAESAVEQLDARLLGVTHTITQNHEREGALERSARGRFETARFRQELRVFGVRLALTLPLLFLAGWLVARKRHSEYWPLLRGVVLFALFAFFVELVPYLPSYGGYVRYGVGIIVSGVAGVYVIRAMRGYLAQRQRVEQQSEGERRRALPYDEALRRIGAGICPGCERAITGSPMNPGNFCVHCGLRLYEDCASCHLPKNAFYPYCPTCGIPAADADAPAPPPVAY